MAHTVRITTTTTENSNVTVLNTGYLCTTPGLLKLAQFILGVVTVGMIAWHYNSVLVHQPATTFALLMTVAFLICTTCLLLSIVASWATGSLIAKTLFELIYHVVALVLLGAAAIVLIVHVNRYKNTFDRYGLYTHYMVAGVLVLVNAILYLASSVLAQRSYRGI